MVYGLTTSYNSYLGTSVLQTQSWHNVLVSPRMHCSALDTPPGFASSSNMLIYKILACACLFLWSWLQNHLQFFISASVQNLCHAVLPCSCLPHPIPAPYLDSWISPLAKVKAVNVTPAEFGKHSCDWIWFNLCVSLPWTENMPRLALLGRTEKSSQQNVKLQLWKQEQENQQSSQQTPERSNHSVSFVCYGDRLLSGISRTVVDPRWWSIPCKPMLFLLVDTDSKPICILRPNT